MSFALTHLIGFGGSPSGAGKTITYEASYTSTSDLTTYTFSSCDIGTASADRRVIVVIGGAPTGGGTARDISTVTIAGVSATINVQAKEGSAGSPVVGIATAAVPTGTTGDIEVVFSGGLARVFIAVYSTTGLSSETANDSDNSLASPGNVTIDTLASGIAVAGAMHNTASTYSWTGVTEDYEGSVEGAEHGTGSLSGTSAGTLNITSTYSASDTRRAMVAASF